MAGAIQARSDATSDGHGWELTSRQQPDVIQADDCRDDRGDNDGGTGQAVHDFSIGRTAARARRRPLAVQAAGAEGPGSQHRAIQRCRAPG
jgi:hypothetical protein